MQLAFREEIAEAPSYLAMVCCIPDI